MAFNNSHIGKKSWEVINSPSPIVWRQIHGPIRSWAVHKKSQLQGDLIALVSQDGREIEIFELLMTVYTPPKIKDDSFTNFQLPIIGVAVVLVLGYQFMKQKNKFEGSSVKSSLPPKRDWDQNLAELKRKRAE